MATVSEINDINSGITNSERLLDVSNQILNSYSERKKSLKEISAEERLYVNTVSQQQRLSQQIAANSDKYLGFLIKSRDLSRDIKTTEVNIGKAKKSYEKIEQKLIDDRKKSITELIELRKKEKDVKKQIDALDLQNDIKRTAIQTLTSKQRITENDKTKIADLIAEIKENDRLANVKDRNLKSLNKEFEKQRSIAESARQIIKDRKEAIIAEKKELGFLKDSLIIRERIEKSTGLLGAVSKDLAKLPGIGKYLNADEAIDAMEKYAAELEETGHKATDFGNRLKIVGRGLSTLAKGFYENIKSPEAVFALFINAALKANEESVNLSKNLGYGAANADRVRAGFVDIERSANDINVTTANLSGAFNELSSATGFVTEYSADALETQIKLTKQLGLSGDEAAGIYELSVLNGKSSEATYQSMLKGYVNTRNSLKVGVNFKAAIAEAAKVSGQLAANMGYNAEKIVSGVIATKALGTSLEQAKSQGASLLEFQSSIEDELQAELITGKQLNLEKARAAALMGDQVAVAEELAAQGMTATEFSNMNVIAQNAYAKALGTTSNELADQLKKREVALASGKSLAQATMDEANEATKRQTIQDRFNAAMEKLQSIIGNLFAGPLGGFLEVLSGALDIVNKIGNAFSFLAGPLQVIAGIWLSIKGIQLAILGAQKISAVYEAAKTGYVIAQRGAALGYNGILLARQAIMSGELAKAIGIAAAWAIANPIPAIAGLTIAAGIGNLIYSQMKDGIIDPEKGPILSGDFGSVQLNPRDKAMYDADGNIKVGTNLTKSKTPSINGPIKSASYANYENNRQAPPLDLTPMISVMNDVKSAIGHLNNKKWDVYLDSSRVGRGMVKGQTQSV